MKAACPMFKNTILCRCITDLSTAFMKEVQDFVKSLYMAGQAELQSKPSSSGISVGGGEHKLTEFNPYQLLVHANGACVDLLFWSIKEESGKLLSYENEASGHIKSLKT